VHWADYLYREILPSVVCLTQCDKKALKVRRSRPIRGRHAKEIIKLQNNHAIGRMFLSTAWCNTDTGTEQLATEVPFDLLSRNCCNV